MRIRRLVLMLICACMALVGLSCSDNPAVRVRYQAEKLFFEAEKASQQAGIRPDLNTPDLLSSLRTKYSDCLDFCYEATESVSASEHPREHHELSELAFRSASRLSQLYYMGAHFDKSVEVFNELLAKAPPEGSSLVNTYLNLGRALQSSGEWDSALVVYNYAVDNFYPPLAEDGAVIPALFNLPSHIFMIYARAGDTAAAAVQADLAEIYYEGLVADYSQDPVAKAARSSLVRLYESTGRWNQAIAHLSLFTDSSGAVSIQAREHIADIHARRQGDFDDALAEYNALLGDLTEADSLQRPMILYKKGLVLLEKKRVAEGRRVLLDVKNAYERFYNGSPAVQTAIARSFELEDNWERAETEYKYLMEKFAGTPEAMSAYLHLADWYSRNGRRLEAEHMEERAETEYDRIAATKAGSYLEASALGHKAELFRRQKNWPKTAEVLCRIFDRFPTSEVGYESLLSASVIYRDKLNDPSAADSLIEEMKKRLTEVDDSGEN